MTFINNAHSALYLFSGFSAGGTLTAGNVAVG
jgi:hypothetical protein